MPRLVVPIFVPSRRALARQLDHSVIRQDHLRPVRDKQLPLGVHAQTVQLLDLFQEGHRIQHHAVADHRQAVRPQHSAGHQLQNELLPVNDHGMAGVVAARIARHHSKALREHIYDLALALIAPLGAQYNCRLRSHPELDISQNSVFCRRQTPASPDRSRSVELLAN